MYDCMVVFNPTLLGRMGGKSGWMVLPPGTAAKSVIEPGQEISNLLFNPGM